MYDRTKYLLWFIGKMEKGLNVWQKKTCLKGLLIMKINFLAAAAAPVSRPPKFRVIFCVIFCGILCDADCR